jgi:hypothetical protein
VFNIKYNNFTHMWIKISFKKSGIETKKDVFRTKIKKKMF